MNDELLATSIAHQLHVPHLIARILVARGCGSLSAAYERFHCTREHILNPLDEKRPMRGMEKAF